MKAEPRSGSGTTTGRSAMVVCCYVKPPKTGMCFWGEQAASFSTQLLGNPPWFAGAEGMRQHTNGQVSVVMEEPPRQLLGRGYLPPTDIPEQMDISASPF